MTATILDFETEVASRRPTRVIGEICVRDGKVVADIPRELTPDQARSWAAQLLVMADSAEREGVEL